MATDLLLRPSCRGCGSTSELYGSNCKHTTLCVSCGKSMAEDKAKCSDCGAILTRLIRVSLLLAFLCCFNFKILGFRNSRFDGCRCCCKFEIQEYSVWVNTVDEKEYFIGKFSTGLPKFLEKKSCENKWSLCKKKTKGGLQGRQDSFQVTSQTPFPGKFDYYLLAMAEPIVRLWIIFLMYMYIYVI